MSEGGSPQKDMLEEKGRGEKISGAESESSPLSGNRDFRVQMVCPKLEGFECFDHTARPQRRFYQLDLQQKGIISKRNGPRILVLVFKHSQIRLIRARWVLQP